MELAFFARTYGPSAKRSSMTNRKDQEKGVIKIFILFQVSNGGRRFKIKQNFNLARGTVKYGPLNWPIIAHLSRLCLATFDQLLTFGVKFCGSSNLEQFLPLWATFEQTIGLEPISSTGKSTISQKTSIYANFLIDYQRFEHKWTKCYVLCNLFHWSNYSKYI